MTIVHMKPEGFVRSGMIVRFVHVSQYRLIREERLKPSPWLVAQTRYLAGV
jgi:hypothetical protein